MHRLEITVVPDQREPIIAGNDAVSAVFETIRSNPEFCRVRAFAYVDLNWNIGGRLGFDWMQPAEELCNAGLQLSCCQPCRTRRRGASLFSPVTQREDVSE